MTLTRRTCRGGAPFDLRSPPRNARVEPVELFSQGLREPRGPWMHRTMANLDDVHPALVPSPRAYGRRTRRDRVEGARHDFEPPFGEREAPLGEVLMDRAAPWIDARLVG